MKIKKSILTFAFGMYSSLLIGQIRLVMPPAPNTSSLGKYVENPIGYYTGVPNISVPLYEIKEKDFSLPISLSYHPGGIKVEDVSSNIGLGWVINAGGVITRSVKDIPDDFKGIETPCTAYYPTNPSTSCRKGLLFSGINIDNTDLEYGYSQDLINNNYSLDNIIDKFYRISYPPQGIDGAYAYFKDVDSEPDVYYFNFCGYTGQFIFQVVNGTATVKFLSNYDLKVQHYLGADGKLAKFEIKDNMGNLYIFEDTEDQSTFSYRIVNGTPSITMEPGAFSSGFDLVGNSSEYRSGWYLSKIITAAGENIIFKYNTERICGFSTVPEQNFIWSPNWSNYFAGYNPNTQNGPFLFLTESFNYQYSKRLMRIESPTVQINFEDDIERQDVRDTASSTVLYPHAITGLTVYSVQNNALNRIKRFKFEQDYFESSIPQAYISFGGAQLYNDNVIANKAELKACFKRLRLRGVQELGITDNCIIPSTSFEYKYKDFSGYNTSDELPYRFSKQQDMWGFYNGAVGNLYSLIPTLYVYPQMFNDSRKIGVYKRNNFTGPEYVIEGANRQPSSEKMDIGMLTKITYPTGGSTFYEYEPHKFKDGTEEFIGGGLRIKSIIKRDGLPNTQPITYNYTYTDSLNFSSGRVINMPQYAIPQGIGTAYALDGTEYSFRANTIRYSVSQAPMGTTQGSNVGYRQVTESISGNGKTQFQFSLPAYWFQSNDAASPISGANCNLPENGICDNLYTATPVTTLFPGTPLRTSDYDFSLFPSSINSYPFPENPNYDWARGQLLKKKFFDESGQLILSEDYNYSNWILNGLNVPTKVYGLKLDLITASKNQNNSSPSSSSIARVWRGAKYYYLADINKVLTSKTTIEYHPENGSSVSKTEEYKYEGLEHPYITQTSGISSTGDEIIKRIKYSGDYITTTGPGGMEGISALKYKQIDVIPIETSVFLKKNGTEYLKEANLSTYDKLGNGLPVEKRAFKIENDQLLNNFDPSSVFGLAWSFKKDLRYVEQSVVNRFDDKGNPLELQTNNGEVVCYIWGYNGKYPIAKVTNATYEQIVAVLTNPTLQDLHKGYYSNQVSLTDTDIRNTIESLRVALHAAHVSTYTYKPLVGMTSETSPNGATIFYEYDCFNRLSSVKDASGKLIKTLEYKIQSN